MTKVTLPKDDEGRIAETLAQRFAKQGFCHEAVDTATPLTALLGKEEGENVEDDRHEVIGAMLDFFCADGVHPGWVLRRVFAVLKAVRPQLLGDMSLEEMGNLFGETRAAQSWRIKKMFTDYQRGKGAKSFKAAFQKSEAAVGSYSRAQKGNTNRRAKPKFRKAA